jgi:hypothetical protein
MTEEAKPTTATATPSKKSRVLRGLAKGLTLGALWAVKHPETVIQIIRQIKTEQDAKQLRQQVR